MTNFFQHGLFRILFVALTLSPSPQVALAATFDHMDFTQVLKDVVVIDGPTPQVDYLRLQKHSLAFNRYLKNLSRLKRADFNALSTPEQTAFLINAYNAFSLKMIVDNYPLKSVKKIPGLQPAPEQARFFVLLGRNSSLDELAKDELVKMYADPRIHFALACPAVSCPGLRTEAYSGDRLDTQLESQTKSFLRNQKQVDFNPESKTLKLSPIFSRFQKDFDSAGGLQKFIGKYISDDPQIVQVISSDSLTIEYAQHNWDLNEHKPTKK